MKRFILKTVVVILAMNLLYPFMGFLPSRLRLIALVVVGFICATAVGLAINKFDSNHGNTDSDRLRITEQRLKISNRLANRTPPAVGGCPDCGGRFKLDGMNELLRIYECKECERRTFEKTREDSTTNQVAE